MAAPVLRGSLPQWRGALAASLPATASISSSASSASSASGRRCGLRGRRWYNVASTPYAGAFGRFPPVDAARLREDTLVYLARFDHKHWFDDPIQSMLHGHILPSTGPVITTVDAWGNDNGKQVLASDEVLDKLVTHLRTYKPHSSDLRKPMRAIEHKLLTTHAAELIGNQALDFHKQDGITEIEESIEANVVERKLNDQLLQDENEGVLTIGRDIAFVGCVSNFSNFLDLCRKVLRNVELGVPVMVLSRSNTTQHMYRWTQLLLSLMHEHQVDPGLVSYASCTVKQQQHLLEEAQSSPYYLTGSRQVAAAIKSRLPKLFASTGGPNTMVATEVTPKVAEAIRNSTLIENSGQCTAMRHLVTPSLNDQSLERVFAEEHVDVIRSSLDSIRTQGFAGLHQDWGETFKPKEGFRKHSSNLPIAYRIGDELPENIEEHWRRVYLDVTTAGTLETLKSSEYLNKVAAWLVKEQPISLAINGDLAEEDYPIARKLFEATALAVYTVGNPDAPCLTAQARPQDAELFGEFPPRRQLTKYTKFPVIVPTATPGYNSTYNTSYLTRLANKQRGDEAVASLRSKLSPEAAGYVNLLADYLNDACGPRRGVGSRTGLWGLQRPPLNGQKSVIRCGSGVSNPLNATVPSIALFLLTNAKEQFAVSCAPEHKDLIAALKEAQVGVTVEDDATFNKTAESTDQWWNVISATEPEFALAGHFVSLHFPLGHIKSTKPADKKFLDVFTQSAKWLRYNGNK